MIRSSMVPISFLLLLLSGVSAFWLLEDVDVSSPRGLRPSTCSQLPGLSRRQRSLCLSHPAATSTIARGIKAGIEECEHVFQQDMWNCSAKARQITGTPEKDCACGDTPTIASRKFLWSGCSDNVKFAKSFSRRFFDSDDKAHADSRSLMNLHNNRAGRRLLSSAMERMCKCHGVSGSCVTRTCWKVVPRLDLFAKELKNKYDSALQVTVTTSESGLELRATSPSTSKRIGRYLKAVNPSEVAKETLVFLDPSPDLCQKREAISGRECGDKCGSVCCGGGWYTRHTIVDEPCDCVFHWCCEVKCKNCTRIQTRNFCN